MRNTIFFIVAIAGLIFQSCNFGSPKTTSESKEYISEVLDLATYKEKMAEEEDFILLDVRTPGEVSLGMIEGAINIDVEADGFIEKIEMLDKTKPVYLYCRSGQRSETAAGILVEHGFPVIYDLKGGYLAWSGKDE
ncbi:MAG: rhodanese-like domain-containing protein [Bacteroidia bacterium]|nr:rhodanese-like domain-containing protein [Bacteroidia bacterium]